MNRPIALNDAQMRLLQRAATTLPVEQRDKFLQQVATHLRGEPETPAVEIAISRAFATLKPVCLRDSASERGT